MLSEPRTQRIEVRFHSDERKAIELAARRAGLNVSDWMRAVALVAAGESKLLAQLQRVTMGTIQ